MILGSAIIVAHNSAGPIEQCLGALQGEASGEDISVGARIVVDNASRDDTIARVERADPQARLIRNAENLGFAAGANCGAQFASGEILLLLNPDTIARPGALDALAHALKQDGVGAALAAYCCARMANPIADSSCVASLPRY